VLEGLPPSGIPTPLEPGRLQRELERVGKAGGNVIASAGASVILSTLAAADDQLVPAVQAAFETLRALQFNDGDAVFPDAAVKFVRCDPALARRATLARVLMRVEDEPELLEKPPERAEGELAFGSGWHLQSDLALSRQAYFAPLFLCCSPWIWALGVGRFQGMVIYEFGSAVVGRMGEAAEPLQLFLPSGVQHHTPRPQFGLTESTEALRWWVDRLNQLFSIISDPANFTADGSYRARRQFEVLLSLEQAGRRVQSILAHDRDLPTRRLLAFSALDTLEGLGAVAFDDACRINRAERALQTVEAVLPPAAATVLLPVAKRAVEGLRACQSGFFASSRVGPNGVRLPDKHGGDRWVSRGDATAQYLRVLRNATHGFSGQHDSARHRDEILLMTHDGEVPGDFALLPYLYWLELLADPGRLRHRLAGRR
jgi:hypothetical protein